MRILISLVLILIVGATAIQLYKLQVKKVELINELEIVDKQVAVLNEENLTIERELTQLQNKERLIREAKAQFNYTKPGEKLIIVVSKNQRD